MSEYISKQAVIDAIDRASQEEWDESRKTSSVVFRILNKLGEIPTVEVKTPRYIDADTLKQIINDNEYQLTDDTNSRDFGMFTVGIMQAIDEASTADVRENLRSEWDEKGCCKNCGEHAPFYVMASAYYKSNFCPNCGANMRERREE